MRRPKNDSIYTVSDDSSSQTRYADTVMEPEETDVEVFDQTAVESHNIMAHELRTEPSTEYLAGDTIQNRIDKRIKCERVDEKDDDDDASELIGLSVADRVSKFQETRDKQKKSSSPVVVEKEVVTEKAVSKTKELFEKIAAKESRPSSTTQMRKIPTNRPLDDASRKVKDELNTTTVGSNKADEENIRECIYQTYNSAAPEQRPNYDRSTRCTRANLRINLHVF